MPKVPELAITRATGKTQGARLPGRGNVVFAGSRVRQARFRDLNRTLRGLTHAPVEKTLLRPAQFKQLAVANAD